MHFAQVLISIQGLILIEQPYFNEPAYDVERNTAEVTVQKDGGAILTKANRGNVVFVYRRVNATRATITRRCAWPRPDTPYTISRQPLLRLSLTSIRFSFVFVLDARCVASASAGVCRRCAVAFLDSGIRLPFLP
jgi:hypothetical protein